MHPLVYNTRDYTSIITENRTIRVKIKTLADFVVTNKILDFLDIYSSTIENVTVEIQKETLVIMRNIILEYY